MSAKKRLFWILTLIPLAILLALGIGQAHPQSSLPHRLTDAVFFPESTEAQAQRIEAAVPDVYVLDIRTYDADRSFHILILHDLNKENTADLIVAIEAEVDAGESYYLFVYVLRDGVDSNGRDVRILHSTFRAECPNPSGLDYYTSGECEIRPMGAMVDNPALTDDFRWPVRKVE